MSLKDFNKTQQDKNPITNKKKNKHPTGFEPGFHYSQATNSGTVVAKPQKKKDVNWEAQLEDYFGKDSKNYEVVEGTVEIRSWQMVVAAGQVETLYYFKAKIVSKKDKYIDTDYKKLLEKASKKKPTSKKKLKKGKTFVICISDLQVGKRGSEEMIDRWVEGVNKITNRIKQLRKTGEPINQLFIAGLGDIVEGCDLYNSAQFETEYDYREQQKIARRMIFTALEQWIPLFDKTLLCFIGGNHGSHRKNNKVFTNWGDNRDIMLGEELAEILAQAPAYKDKVSCVFPKNEIALTLDINGVITTLTHGDNIKHGSNPQAKAKNWLAKKSLDRDSGISDTDLLLMGHYHFFSAFETGNRLILQAPTLDTGSQWYENTGGDKSNPGILTLVLGGKSKWGNIEVIR